MITLYIIMIIAGCVFTGFGIWHFVIAHNYTLLEMSAQIEKFGFYKDDIVLLEEIYTIHKVVFIGAVLLLLIGLTLIAIGIGLWINDYL